MITNSALTLEEFTAMNRQSNNTPAIVVDLVEDSDDYLDWLPPKVRPNRHNSAPAELLSVPSQKMLTKKEHEARRPVQYDLSKNIGMMKIVRFMEKKKRKEKKREKRREKKREAQERRRRSVLMSDND